MVSFDEKVLWMKMSETKEGMYKGKKFKIIDDVTEEPDVFNPEKKKFVLHMIEEGTGNKYNGNLNNASIYGLMKAWGKETVNWSGETVTVEAGIVKGKDTILFKPVIKER